MTNEFERITERIEQEYRSKFYFLLGAVTMAKTNGADFGGMTEWIDEQIQKVYQ